MPEGLLPLSLLPPNRAPESRVPKCGACGLLKTCKTPKMPVAGQGRRRILILGEAPGKDEDEQGEPFVGKTGRHLRAALSEAGVDLRDDCWITNAVICRPPGNATPIDEIDYCRPNLTLTLERLQPDIIVPLGNVAIKSLLATIWKDDDIGNISRWAGFQIPCQKLNAWVCPTYHPSFVVREESGPVPDIHFHEHLAAVAQLEGRPWRNVPDYESKVERIFSPREAAKIIREQFMDGGMVAFDYECNTVKPETPGALLVCCSICWRGKRTISYPWQGDAIQATLELLVDARIPKVGTNIKFEQRWTKHALGRRVKNWWWDTMIAAHWEDCRPGITSLKFQAFVQLGAPPYDEHLKPALKAKKGKQLNQILEEIDLNSLLLYNGLDSLYEYKLAARQMKTHGYPLPEEE